MQTLPGTVRLKVKCGTSEHPWRFSPGHSYGGGGGGGGGGHTEALSITVISYYSAK